MKKVLHVTNELSEKNFSITSIILYILKDNKRNEAFAYFSNYSINSAQLSLFKKFFLDFLYIKNFFEYKKYNIVHIHGLWSFIQFFSIIISDQLKIKTIIHPHGMLLPEALKNNFGIRLFLKLLLLKILNKICNTLYFVAVTKQEFNSVKKYFPGL
jgi:glycosyltransferase involved in cell wall biosynthesis